MNTPAIAPWANTAYGVDLTEANPIIIKGIKTGRTISFESVDRTTLSSLPAHSIIAGSLLQKESFTRWLTAPIASPKKAEKVFPSLLDIQLPFSVEDCEYTLLETQPTVDRSGTRGLVTGCRSVDIGKRLSLFAALDLNPHILDQEGIALWTQSLEESPAVTDGPELRIILYLSSERVTLSIGRDKEFIAAHTMRQLDADQIHRFLKSSIPSPPPLTQWLITGPQASLAESVDSPIVALLQRWPGPLKITREPHTFLARALAIRAMTPGALRCNLRTGRFLHPVLAQREAKRPFHWAIACLIAGLLLCITNLAWSLFAAHRTDAIQSTLRALAIEITGSSAGIPYKKEVLTAQRTIETQTRDMEPFLAASDSPIPQTLKFILLVAREEGLSVETMTLGRNNMVIHGIAPKWAQAEAASRRLNSLGWLATLERKESPLGEDRVAFVISLGRAHGKK